MPPSPVALAGRTRSKSSIAIVGALVAAVVLALVLVVNRGNDNSKVSATKTPPTNSDLTKNAEAPQTPGAGGSIQGGAGGGSGTAGGGVVLKPINPAEGTKDMPLAVLVSNTKGLRDGDIVKIRITAKPGSQIFAFEAFLCTGGATYLHDDDIRPSFGGKCTPEPLSPSSQRYLDVKGVPPYQVVEGDFRVGIGSKAFSTLDGRAVTVTCDRSHPCTLALKLQYPNAFGFDPIPLTFR